jgi:hypothetical protein
MKICTFARTFRRLELPHIAAFLASHSFCDTIYLGTCLTDPATIEIAKQYSNVKFREFGGLMELADGELVAREGAYYQFLVDWAKEEIEKGNIDILLMDDVDHVPCPALQRDARRLIEESNAPFFYSLLMYVWGTEMYFPELNKCCPMERLWGWNVHKWTPDINPDHPNTVEIRNQPDRDIENGLTFSHPPYCILHYSYLNEEIVRAKMAFNARRGVAQAYPLESCGHLEPIPEWAKE